MSESKLDQITAAMMEHVCDCLCRYPVECGSEDELEEICAECQMGQFVCGILNSDNRHIAGKGNFMKKDDLILEYLDLALEYMSFSSPAPVDEKRKGTVVNRLMEIRALLGMKTISLC